MFGKICIHGGKLQLLVVVFASAVAKLLAPKWHFGRKERWNEDPFFLGWIRTKARKRRRRRTNTWAWL